MSATLLLLTIPASHFCEKARWALQRAGLAFHEEQHVPGFARRATRAYGPPSTVPLMLGPRGVLRSSSDIARFADENLPQHQRLFDGDTETEALVARFDEVLAPAARRVRYHDHLADPRAFLASVGTRVPALELLVFKLFRPLAARVMRKRIGLSDVEVAGARRDLRLVLDEVAARLGDGRRYLLGERFTAADLTFAALMAPLVAPRWYGGVLVPEALWSDSWRKEVEATRAHPAGAYVTRLYEEDRRKVAPEL